jgi:hypothetical protein
MHLWNVKQLATDFKNQSVTESQKMAYFLITTVLWNLVAYMNVFADEMSYKDPNVGYFELFLVVVIVIVGTLVTFKTNKKTGVDYIARVTALAIPIGIKFLVFLFAILAIFFGLDEYVWSYNVLDILYYDSFTVISTVVIEVFVFWRINIYLKYING